MVFICWLLWKSSIISYSRKNLQRCPFYLEGSGIRVQTNKQKQLGSTSNSKVGKVTRQLIFMELDGLLGNLRLNTLNNLSRVLPSKWPLDQCSCRQFAGDWQCGVWTPAALNANLRLSPPTAFAIHHLHIQMALIVFLVLFLCRVAALKWWCISVGSNFIIHLVIQLLLFVEEEMETQREEIPWSKLPSYLVSSWDKNIYLLDLSPVVIPVHQDLIFFGKTCNTGLESDDHKSKPYFCY